MAAGDRASAFPSPVLLATGNPGKRAEWRALLGELRVEVVVRDLPSPEEDGATYLDNAVLKGRAATARLGLVALGDDGGFEVDDWEGRPGPFTRRWAMEQGGWDAAREVLAAAAGSGATMVCAAALTWPDGRWVGVTGRVRGRVVPATVDGPGLEPCFLPDGADAPMPALPPEAWKRSHQRPRALRLLMAQLALPP